MANAEELTLANLAGSWSLDHIEAVGPDSTARAERPEVAGVLTYTDSGHMSAVVQAPENLFGFSFVAYAGSVAIDGGRIIHHVTVGAEPTGPGTSLAREAAISHAAVTTLTLTGRIEDISTTLAWHKNPPRHQRG